MQRKGGVSACGGTRAGDSRYDHAMTLLWCFFVALAGGWWWRQRRARAQARARSAATARTEAVSSPKDVQFRARGERGMGGPVFGDVLCTDGVYLPHVWEADFQLSFDGRWIRTGHYDGKTPQLIDRKTRHSWNLSVAEAAAVEAIQWRLPRWSGEELNESGLADDGHTVLSDARFTGWLQAHVHQPGVPLVALRDLWLPWDGISHEPDVAPPALPEAPHSAPPVTLERHWPPSLRELEDPLDAYHQAYWQLHIRGEPQPWVITAGLPLVWRDDGVALAVYAYELIHGNRQPQLQLAVWSVGGGWVAWSETVPTDRKPWRVWCDISTGAQASSHPPLVWEGNVVLQRVAMDTPQLERLHDGGTLHCLAEPGEAVAAQRSDGVVHTRPRPLNTWQWRRDPDARRRWQAQSVPLQHCPPLVWTLTQEARDIHGATPAYQLHCGPNTISGNWELEHVVVQGRWVVLLAHGRTGGADGSGAQVHVWDGAHLHPVTLPWRVQRLRAVPAVRGQAPKVELLAVSACIRSTEMQAQQPVWQWPLQSVTSDGAVREEHVPVYSVQTLALDGPQGPQWLPRWREVASPQHPCADGDYLWRKAPRGDALWWWGGWPGQEGMQWEPHTPRHEGISVTRSGMVLCGSGPAALPHPDGQGWVVLECVHPAGERAGQWRLHWLQSDQKEVRTLVLSAWMPVLRHWDELGLHWVDSEQPASEREAGHDGQVPEAPAPRTVVLEHWNEAQVEPLRAASNGLWLRKQDLRYAGLIWAQPDHPWARH